MVVDAVAARSSVAVADVEVVGEYDCVEDVEGEVIIVLEPVADCEFEGEKDTVDVLDGLAPKESTIVGE